GKHVFSYQENNFLQIYIAEYISPYFLKPGGLTELTGKTLIQFYYFPVSAAFILSGILLLPGIILIRISRKLNEKSPAIYYNFFIIPTFILWLLQSFYYHFMEYNIGFIVILAYFYFTVTMAKRR